MNANRKGKGISLKTFSKYRNKDYRLKLLRYHMACWRHTKGVKRTSNFSHNFWHFTLRHSKFISNESNYRWNGLIFHYEAIFRRKIELILLLLTQRYFGYYKSKEKIIVFIGTNWNNSGLWHQKFVKAFHIPMIPFTICMNESTFFSRRFKVYRFAN